MSTSYQPHAGGVRNYDGKARGDSGEFRGDLSRAFTPINLRTLWLMMTGWGDRAARQQRYRDHFKPRWPAQTSLGGNTFDE